MQPQQEENLKKLINASAVLNANEKAEWLLLLGVMNDKQVGELEKILGSGSRPKEASPAPAVKSPAMPALSHIMNLPAGPIQGAAPTPPPIAAPTLKNPSAFASKLKMMFAEKELPASTRAAPALIESTRGGPAGKQEEALSSPKVKTPPPPIKLPASPPPAGSAVSPGALKAQLPPKIAAGISFPKISPSDQQDTLKAIKEHMGQTSEPAAPAVAKIRPIEKINFQDLGDLTLLTPQILAKNDLGVMVGNIRDLIRKHSYHEALFNIEKSELYKTYLSTGLKLLTDQINFEELATRPRAEAYLEREEFEKFADMLRQIQSA